MDSSLIIDHLYKKRHTTDVCFIVADEEKGRSIRIPAHKCILAVGSSVFDDMFYSAAKQFGDIEISKPHISSEGFKAFLDMFYGKVDPKIVGDYFFELMHLTNDYAVHEFKSMCVEIMKDRIEIDDLCFILELAVDTDSIELRDICLNKFKRNWVEAINSDWFQQLFFLALEEILQLECAQRDEILLFERCIDWAKESCKKKDLDPSMPSNWRKVLHNFLDHIHFDKMTMEEFTSLKGVEVFTSDKMQDIKAEIILGTLDGFNSIENT